MTWNYERWTFINICAVYCPFYKWLIYSELVYSYMRVSLFSFTLRLVYFLMCYSVCIIIFPSFLDDCHLNRLSYSRFHFQLCSTFITFIVIFLICFDTLPITNISPTLSYNLDNMRFFRSVSLTFLYPFHMACVVRTNSHIFIPNHYHFRIISVCLYTFCVVWRLTEPHLMCIEWNIRFDFVFFFSVCISTTATIKKQTSLS